MINYLLPTVSFKKFGHFFLFSTVLLFPTVTQMQTKSSKVLMVSTFCALSLGLVSHNINNLPNSMQSYLPNMDGFQAKISYQSHNPKYSISLLKYCVHTSAHTYWVTDENTRYIVDNISIVFLVPM